MPEKREVHIEVRELGDRCCADELSFRFTQDEIERTSEDLRLLGHPIRLQILQLLAQNAGKVCVCDLEAALPVKQPTISHHLRLLKEAGLVETVRDGLWMYYFIKRDALASVRERLNVLLTTIT